MPETLTVVAFALHVGGGVIGLLSGIFAMTARKGERVHRLAGDTFFASMLVMAAFAVYLGLRHTGRLVNVFIGVFVAYLVATAWITVRRPAGVVGLSEWIGLAAALILCAPFMLLSGQLALGPAALLSQRHGVRGPLLIAIYLFTLVLAIAAGSDAVVVFSGGVSGASRDRAASLAHVCGLTLATGSALSNGLPRLLPPHYRLPEWTLFLQFIWVILMFYWLIRVRLMGWAQSRREGAASPTPTPWRPDPPASATPPPPPRGSLG